MENISRVLEIFKIKGSEELGIFKNALRAGIPSLKFPQILLLMVKEIKVKTIHIFCKNSDVTYFY